jgi:hypothetical protein
MPSFFSISVLAAVAFIAIVSTSLSQPSSGFDLTSDGAKAVFKFFDSNWDVIFGTISFRSLSNRTAALEVWFFR